LEEDGQLAAGAEMYRAAMAAAGPKAEICFQVAELLYRQGDLGGARERYYMAIELDEDYVEARANLGCVLAETGQRELAVAAFEGALRYHPDYADVRYHLARTLDEMHEREQADEHWRIFLAQAPDSPWAEEARSRLGSAIP
jgi:tetratricopeptide (TPR) repeat protein